MMTVATHDWHRLSRLLDAVLALPPAERSAWLETLAEEDRVLEPLLRELLTRPDLAENGSFLHALPHLSAPKPA